MFVTPFLQIITAIPLRCTPRGVAPDYVRPDDDCGLPAPVGVATKEYPNINLITPIHRRCTTAASATTKSAMLYFVRSAKTPLSPNTIAITNPAPVAALQ